MAAASAAALEWVRVDQLLEAASTQLGVGDMVQCETFSLFEAMSAVEVGNPKMDAGSSSEHLESAHDLIDKGSVPLKLQPALQLAVMEKLLVLEASHYCMATPLATSVYTSVYMMLDKSRVAASCPLLAAFCEGLQESCIAVRWLIFNGSVSEEEDFNTLVTGLPCEAGMPVGGAGKPSSSCLQTLSAALKSAQQQAGKLQGEDAEVYRAIAARLTFRRELHAALLDLQPKSAASLTSCHAHCAAALAALDACTKAPVPREQMDAAPGFVEGLNKHLLGPAPPRSVSVPSQGDASSAVKTLLQHVQEATRIAETSGYREVHQFIERFASLRAGVVARAALHYLVAGKAWAASLPAPLSEQQPAQPQDDSTAAGNGQDPASSKQEAGAAAAGAGAAVGSPPWALDRPMLCEALALPVSPSLGEEVELFLEQAAIAVGNWAQAMLLNPCRQRRRLRRGLDDWANLYQHALNADLSAGFGSWADKAGWRWTPGQAGPPHQETGELDLQGPLATWVVVGTCDCQITHLLLGWELDLYSPNEYCCLYFYLHHLLNIKCTSLRLLHSVQAPAGGKVPMQLPAKPTKGGGKSKASPAPPPITPATARRQAALMADAMCTEVTTLMCMGMSQLMLSLDQAGLVPTPPLIFNTLTERFDQRFGSFHEPNLIRPEPLPLQNFLEATRIGDVTSSQMLGMSARSFSQLRQQCGAIKQKLSGPEPQGLDEALSPDQQAGLAAMDRLAATNMLAATILARAVDAGTSGRMTVSYDFAVHPHWPTLKVKSLQAGP